MLGDRIAANAPLCGHTAATQRIGTMQESASLCSPCFRRMAALRDDFMTRRISFRELRRQAQDIVGSAEARGYSWYLWRARLFPFFARSTAH